MHHMKLGNYSINFNGDFTGDIIVSESDGRGFIGTREVARMPFMVFAAVVGEKVRREKISNLEQADPMDIIYGQTDRLW